MTDKELEILFRKKFDNREVPFDASGWTNIERMMDAKRVAAARQRRSLWGSATALVAASVAVIFIVSTAPEAIYVPSSAPVELPVAADENSVSESYLNQWEENNQRGSTSTQNLKGRNEVSAKSNSVIADAHGESALRPSDELADAYIAAEESPVVHPEAIVNSIVGENENESPIITAQNKEENSSIGLTGGTILAQEKMDSDSIPENSIAYEEVEVQDLTTLKSTSNIQESAIIRKINPSPAIAKHRFGVEALISSSQAQGSDGTIVGGSVALTYDWMLFDRMGIHTGLGYSIRAAGPQDPTSGIKVYSFGSRIQTLDIQANKMHYIEMPIQWFYSLNKRHVVEIGGYISGLIAVENTVTETNTYSNADQTVETRSAYGYEEPYSSLDAGIALGYAYNLSDSWRIQAQYWHGLSDMMVGNSSAKHIQFRLGINYALFK